MADPRRRRGAVLPGSRKLLAASLLGAAAGAGLAAVLYAAVTSIPFIATTATTDPRFGATNDCLMRTLDAARLGFAVSADGELAAAYGGSAVAVCDRDGRGRRLAVSGVHSATFDGEGGLWLGTAGPELLRVAPPPLGEGRPVRTGSLTALSLAGHAEGLAAVDEQGRLLSIAPAGQVRASVPLPAPSDTGASIAVAPGGALLAVVSGGWLGLYNAGSLERRAQLAPCSVERARWLAGPGRLVLSCGGQEGGWALTLEVATGDLALADRSEQEGPTRLWGSELFFLPCDNLPCSAEPR